MIKIIFLIIAIVLAAIIFNQPHIDEHSSELLWFGVETFILGIIFYLLSKVVEKLDECIFIFIKSLFYILITIASCALMLLLLKIKYIN